MEIDTAQQTHFPPSSAAWQPGSLPTVVVAEQELTIFVESPPLIEALLSDIRAARTRIWVETYIFLNDAAGQAIAEALQERARAGLDVRVLYDAFGSADAPGSFFRRMKSAGVKLHAYHSLWEALWRFSFLPILNRRDHRKLIAIDNRIAYFGGMNLVAPGYTTRPRKGRRPVSIGWRDIHLRLYGARQADIARSFELSWRTAHGLPAARRSRAERQARLTAGEETIQFFDCGPALTYTRAWRVFSQVLRNTRHSLELSMAYFLPYGRVLRDLLRAHRRGVFIRLVVPGESDVPVVQSATRHLYTKLLRRRFHIFERQRNMLHSKALVADDEWSIIGSCNLDARSLRINLEFLAVVRSRRLAKVLSDIIHYEVSHSRRITVRQCLRQGWWRRSLDRMAWLLRRWL